MSGVSEGRPEPRTEAGRALLARLQNESETPWLTPIQTRAAILAIEDEAGSPQETPGLREALERLVNVVEANAEMVGDISIYGELSVAAEEAAAALSGSPQETPPPDYAAGWKDGWHAAEAKAKRVGETPPQPTPQEERDAVLAERLDWEAAREVGETPPGPLDVERLLDVRLRNVIVLMEQEGVVTWGDDHHRDRFLAHLRLTPASPSPTDTDPESYRQIERLYAPGTIPVDAIDAIRTLPHITVDRMLGLWVNLDQVTGLLKGWTTPPASPSEPPGPLDAQTLARAIDEAELHVYERNPIGDDRFLGPLAAATVILSRLTPASPSAPEAES